MAVVGRRNRCCLIQLKRLNELVEENFIKEPNRHFKPRGSLSVQETWVRITNIVNTLGPSKTAACWKKSWFEFRKRSEEKRSKIDQTNKLNRERVNCAQVYRCEKGRYTFSCVLCLDVIDELRSLVVHLNGHLGESNPDSSPVNADHVVQDTEPVEELGHQNDPEVKVHHLTSHIKDEPLNDIKHIFVQSELTCNLIPTTSDDVIKIEFMQDDEHDPLSIRENPIVNEEKLQTREATNISNEVDFVDIESEPSASLSISISSGMRNRANRSQLNQLVASMDERFEFKSGKHMKPKGTQSKHDHWTAIADLLNTMGSPKTTNGWKKTWMHMKQLATTKLAQRSQAVVNNTEPVPLKGIYSNILRITQHNDDEPALSVSNKTQLLKQPQKDDTETAAESWVKCVAGPREHDDGTESDWSVSSLESTHEIVNGASDMQCIKCRVAFTSTAKRDYHLRQHKANPNYKLLLCKFGNCKFSCRYHDSLEAHIAKFHIEAQCGQCPLKFASVSGMRLHQHVHNKQLECDICHKMFGTRYSIRMHMVSHTKHKRYMCSECGAEFAYSFMYNRHRRRHLGDPDKKYVCDQCGKKYATPGHLKTHMISHSNVRDYACPACEKTFMLKDNLTIHYRRTHTDERPWKCRETGCPMAFRNMDTRKRHEVKIHGHPAPDVKPK